MAIEADLVERTMHLSEADRAELARRLILSLEPGEIEADVERAWEIEIERRISAYEKGEANAVDWPDAVKRAKAALGKIG
jgi:putative addiction module component (TIGR02574 family)